MHTQAACTHRPHAHTLTLIALGTLADARPVSPMKELLRTPAACASGSRCISSFSTSDVAYEGMSSTARLWVSRDLGCHLKGVGGRGCWLAMLSTGAAC